MHLNLWNNKKILRRSALFGAACGSLAIASMGRAQGRSQGDRWSGNDGGR
ncbi:MAG: hypothetical protein ACK5EO_08220 [Planctomycetota bacterium]